MRYALGASSLLLLRQKNASWRPSIVCLLLCLAATSMLFDLAQAQDGNPCAMEILVFDSLTPCTSDLTAQLGSALLVADGQCRTVETPLSPSDPSYSLLPGNYRAECINSTAVRFVESGCTSPQCNTTSLVTGEKCDRNFSSAASLYSRVAIPEFNTYASRDGSYRCTQANGGDNVTVSFVIFGDCSSPTCAVTSAPVTSAPIFSTPAPATSAPIAAPTPTASPIVVTPPSFEGTTRPNDNPTKVPAPSAPIAAPVAPITTPITTPTSAPAPVPTTIVTDKSASGGGMSAGVVAGIGVGAALLAMVLALWLVHARRRRHNSGGKAHLPATKDVGDDFFDDDERSDRPSAPLTAATAPPRGNTTNEIWIDPDADEVSTLGGGTLPPLGGAFAQDEPTASVNLDFDFARNQYRTGAGDMEDRTQSQQTTASTAFTALSKLGIRGETEFADDISFEEQFAELDDDAERRTVADPMAQRVQPFEVRAPPGKLGMVIDTPNGGVPVVRAIRADSVLSGRVQMGDRLISVDHINVTSMSALEVSNLISLKQNQPRLLIFCRLNPPVQ